MKRYETEEVTSETVSKSSFEITWPQELAEIQPLFAVGLPKGWRAEVYRHVRASRYEEESAEEGYKVIFRTSTGKLSKDVREEFKSSLLGVKLCIEYAADYLRPKEKRTTRTQRHDYDEE